MVNERLQKSDSLAIPLIPCIKDRVWEILVLGAAESCENEFFLV